MAADDTDKHYPYYSASKAVATGAWAEKRRVAAAMRTVIERLVSADAPVAQLTEAAEQLEKFAETLQDYPRRNWQAGYAESANAGDVSAMFDMSPLIGLSNPIAPPIRFEVQDQRVHGRVTFGNAYEGPPGHVHGGIIAAAFDEVLGFVQCMTGQPGMTGTLTIRYSAPTPLHRDLRFEAWVERIEGRKTFAQGTLHSDDTLCARAEGVFIGMDRDRFRELVARKEAGDSVSSKIDGRPQDC